jgi:hypothetical protein
MEQTDRERTKKLLGNGQLEDRRKWNDNIKMDLSEIEQA